MDMDFEEEVESRKKLDEQKRKLQKEVREIEEKFICFLKRFRKVSRVTCSSNFKR